MIRLSHSAGPAVAGLVAVAALAAVTGCGSGSPGPSVSGSGSVSGTSQSSSFRQCLEKHGVTPPSGGHPPGSGGTAVPHPRPTGSAASAFRQAIRACGGFGGFGGGGGFGSGS